MSHELVRKYNDVTKQWEYLFCSRDGNSWHGLGVQEADFDRAVNHCGFQRTITCERLTSESGRLIPDRRGVFDSDNRYLGTVGPDYEVHQDGDLVNLARVYLDTGLVEFDTCGMLLGGSRIWISLRVKESEVDIQPNDPIKTNLFLAQGHDGTLGVIPGGYSDVRIVCNNTMCMALREGNIPRLKHTGEIVKRANEAADEIRKILEERRSRVEVYQNLARTDVNGKDALAFCKALNGKEGVAERSNSLLSVVMEKFYSGIGNKGKTWWDLLNAVTEKNTHHLGNKMEGDQDGDREGRKLNKMFFGADAAQNNKALALAVKMSQAT